MGRSRHPQARASCSCQLQVLAYAYLDPITGVLTRTRTRTRPSLAKCQVGARMRMRMHGAMRMLSLANLESRSRWTDLGWGGVRASWRHARCWTQLKANKSAHALCSFVLAAVAL